MAIRLNPIDVFRNMAGAQDNSAGSPHISIGIGNAGTGQSIQQSILGQNAAQYKMSIENYPIQKYKPSINITVDMVDNGYVISDKETKYIAKDMIELQDFFISLITTMQLNAAIKK